MSLLSDIFWAGVRRAIIALLIQGGVVWFQVRVHEIWPIMPPPLGGPFVAIALGVAFSWAFSMVLYLRAFRFVCPVCQNVNEPLGLLAYWRGHGAHEWHGVGQ